MQPIDDEDPIPLSVRPTRRKRWSSAPPPPMQRPKSRLAMTLFGAIWVVLGVASVTYVVQRSHDSVATSEAR